MFRIEVNDFSESAYPHHLFLKADKIGALEIVNISEVKEGQFDFIIEADDWAVINALHCIRPKSTGVKEVAVKMSCADHPIWMNVSFSTRSAGDGFVDMKLPEWAVANIIIALLTTTEMNALIEKARGGTK